MNTVADWGRIHDRYVRSTISLRALALEEGLSPSTVLARARSDGWAADREKFRNGVAIRSVQALVESQAEELVAARGEAIDALRKGLGRFVENLDHRKKVREPAALDPDTGEVIAWEIVERPVMNVTPKDLAILIDKVNILSGQPSSITRNEMEGRVEISGAIEQLPADVLVGLAELGRARLPDAGSLGRSALPRIEDPRPAGDES